MAAALTGTQVEQLQVGFNLKQDQNKRISKDNLKIVLSSISGRAASIDAIVLSHQQTTFSYFDVLQLATKLISEDTELSMANVQQGFQGYLPILYGNKSSINSSQLGHLLKSVGTLRTLE